MHDKLQGVAPSTKPVVQVSPFETLGEMFRAAVVLTCGEGGFDIWYSGISRGELLSLLEGWVRELQEEQYLLPQGERG